MPTRGPTKRVSMSQISYLRTRLRAAPEAVVTPIEEWVASEIDRLHFVNMRDWPAASTALSRGTISWIMIAPACVAALMPLDRGAAGIVAGPLIVTPDMVPPDAAHWDAQEQSAYQAGAAAGTAFTSRS